jgi:hypothetical protein
LKELWVAYTIIYFYVFIGTVHTTKKMLACTKKLKFPWSVSTLKPSDLSDEVLAVVDAYNSLERCKEEVVILSREKSQLIETLGTSNGYLISKPAY